MRKQTPVVEWHVAENDADWERLQTPAQPDTTPDPALATHRRLSAQRVLPSVAVMLFLLASAGAWWWRTTQDRSHPAEVEVTATAQPAVAVLMHQPDPLVVSPPGPQSDPGWWLQHGQEVRELRTAVQTAEPQAHLDIVVDTVEVHGDQAVTRVVSYTEQGAPAYRQTRFYQRTATGWQQTAPDAALWGPERSLETTFFVFHFRQNDAAAVLAVAPQVDTLYATLRGNFGLPLTPGAEKLVIDVSVTQPPGQMLPWLRAQRFSVPSPAVYRVSVELTDTELLEQSIALPLLAYVLAQISEHDAMEVAWQPMLSGLHLWQMWDLDLPLATWRAEVVRWLYVDLPAVGLGQTFVLPERYPELCAAHKRWLPSPAQINIPLMCARPEWEEQSFPLWRLRDPLTRLEQFSVPAPKSSVAPQFPVVHPGQTVALATLIEYAVATYGRERLPALVAGLGQYDSWDTLLPPVFGVSAAEFEAGWQAYLADRYGVPLSLRPLHN